MQSKEASQKTRRTLKDRYQRYKRISELKCTMEDLSFIVDSQRVQFNRAKGTLLTAYDYQTTRVVKDASGKLLVKPVTETLTFKTDCKVPRVGCMLVGWGGNNGCTVTAAVLANKFNLEWRNRDGFKVRARMRVRTQYLTCMWYYLCACVVSARQEFSSFHRKLTILDP